MRSVIFLHEYDMNNSFLQLFNGTSKINQTHPFRAALLAATRTAMINMTATAAVVAEMIRGRKSAATNQLHCNYRNQPFDQSINHEFLE